MQGYLCPSVSSLLTGCWWCSLVLIRQALHCCQSSHMVTCVKKTNKHYSKPQTIGIITSTQEMTKQHNLTTNQFISHTKLIYIIQSMNDWALWIEKKNQIGCFARHQVINWLRLSLSLWACHEWVGGHKWHSFMATQCRELPAHDWMISLWNTAHTRGRVT